MRRTSYTRIAVRVGPHAGLPPKARLACSTGQTHFFRIIIVRVPQDIAHFSGQRSANNCGAITVLAAGIGGSQFGGPPGSRPTRPTRPDAVSSRTTTRATPDFDHPASVSIDVGESPLALYAPCARPPLVFKGLCRLPRPLARGGAPRAAVPRPGCHPKQPIKPGRCWGKAARRRSQVRRVGTQPCSCKSRRTLPRHVIVLGEKGE